MNSDTTTVAEHEPAVDTAGALPGLVERPKTTNSPIAWLTTVDHKKIGILYGVTAFVWFAVGGLEALMIRTQLAQPNGQILSADTYNQMFTMHGTTMVFLVAMPLAAAFANYLIPLMIGAGDVAFPRLNALSYWTFLLGGLVASAGFFVDGAASGGWFMYAPNSSVTYNPSHGIDFWIWGLVLAGIASTVGALNLLTTIVNMRAPGMTWFRTPVFVWMAMVVQALLVTALPVITVALIMLMFDRTFETNFFNVSAGASPVLWQHLFWIFGHPEVYIIILPSMGIVSEILPVFARKPLFGYKFIVFSGAAIGFVGFGVWAHHMFTVGMGPVAVTTFTLTTMMIAIPTGVKIFNWLGTIQGGSIRFSLPMMYSVAFIAMFTLGGLSGVTHSVSPSDRQQTDSYYVVAHFHYVLFGGAMFGLMAGVYYWWPKMFGYKLDEKRGRVQFWLWFVGFNMTFAPMHVLGLQGMPRRIYTYADGFGWTAWNGVATVGSYILGTSLLCFGWVVWWSRRRARAALGVDPSSPKGFLLVVLAAVGFVVGLVLDSSLIAGLSALALFLLTVGSLTLWLADGKTHCEDDPWDARTLEWSVSSPPPPENFPHTPRVHILDDFWHRKYAEINQRVVRRDKVVPQDWVDNTRAHIPSPSFWPLATALMLPLIAVGTIFGRDDGRAFVLTGLGVLGVVYCLFAWATEPGINPRVAHSEHDAESVVASVEG